MDKNLTGSHIVKLIYQVSENLNTNLDSSVFREIDNLSREYPREDFSEFVKDLTNLANKTGVLLIKKELTWSEINALAQFTETPFIIFLNINEELLPAIVNTGKKGRKRVIVLAEDEYSLEFDAVTEKDVFVQSDKITLLSAISSDISQGKDSDQPHDQETNNKPRISPARRLIRLLSAEKKDIIYVYIYALFIGIISLSLPLGIQAAIEIIAGGVFFSSIYFLIGIIILGVLGMGVLQVFQITIVEYLQRRVFTKAAFEFAFRVPKIKMESILHLHFPELMNRFFDVLTIQKGLPKLLIDLTTGAVQILFGLILLSFYHPFFVFFGLFLITILFLIFYTTGPKGLSSSIVESKYKYKAVYWLEELARALYSFKMSGSTDLPLKRTDYFVNNYLVNRKDHFKVLVTQYSFVLLFKVIITAGLLIIGAILVINREITLGQFVASEVIIILILNSVEKLIMYMDVVYDMLTAVEKISQVTDLPMEKSGGIDLNYKNTRGLEVEVQNLSYSYPQKGKKVLKNIDLKINSSERICLSGHGGAGKSTLINLLTGIYTSYDGAITFNGFSLRDLDIANLRDKIGKNVSSEDIFEGTILDNILVGKPGTNDSLAIEVLKKVDLLNEVNQLPSGLNQEILSGGKGYSHTFVQKLILARCLAKNPKMLILNDFFHNFSKRDKLKIIERIIDKDFHCTVLIVSNDPLIMAACDRIIYLSAGKVLATGSYEEVLQNEEIYKNIA